MEPSSQQSCVNRGLRECHWLQVVLWAGLIWLISSFSAEFSIDNVDPHVMSILRVAVPESSLSDLYYVIRKSVHPVMYFILGLLFFRAIRGPREGWQIQWAAGVLLLSAIYATSDELHQMFVSGRTASVRDVLLDVTGAVLSQIAVWAKDTTGVSSGQKGFRYGRNSCSL